MEKINIEQPFDIKQPIQIRGKCPHCNKIHAYSGIAAIGATILEKTTDGKGMKIEAFTIGGDFEESVHMLVGLLESLNRINPAIVISSLVSFSQSVKNVQVIVANPKLPEVMKDEKGKELPN